MSARGECLEKGWYPSASDSIENSDAARMMSPGYPFWSICASRSSQVKPYRAQAQRLVVSTKTHRPLHQTHIRMKRAPRKHQAVHQLQSDGIPCSGPGNGQPPLL